ncbi:MAG TPA: sigma 54-interacting transcriptional regulator [Terriglobales bacterium]|nr:sigma 54-interacting transcriptional regulator [Terriglobales bacterium]
MNPRLVAIVGTMKGKTFELSERETLIGRDPSNHIWASDPALSRKHCALTLDNGSVWLRDLGSYNGTHVNGVKIEQHELQSQDQIGVGDSVFVFVLGHEEVRPRAEVEFTETGELGNVPVLLQEKDAIYLHPETVAPGPHNTRATRDLNWLLKVAKDIGNIRDPESLQWQLLGMVFDVVPAERAAILQLDSKTGQAESTVAWDRLSGPGEIFKVSRSVLRKVCDEKAGLLVKDIASDSSLSAVQTLATLQVHSLLCVPLMMQNRVSGAIYLDSRSSSAVFDENHLQVMTAVACITSLALENARHWQRLEEENRLLRAEISVQHNMVGESPRMRQIYEVIRRVAPTDSTVLIQGESGTGKELVANAIHRNSPRASRPFVALNCAAITETLLESEMFGHEKGAFTGAVARKQGKIEVAEGGTLFLDEIGELAPALQAKLLRVLQELEFERVGGTRPIKANVRVVAATNKNLQQLVNNGAFRGDLYYRLNVVSLTMPALRERREDLPALVDHFITKISRKFKIPLKSLSPEARACLVGYDWPGNVRELENAIERALVLGTAESILLEDLPEDILEAATPAQVPASGFLGAVKDSKRQLIVQALQRANGNYIEAAKILGLHPNSLLRLIRNLNLKGAVKPGSAAVESA